MKIRVGGDNLNNGNGKEVNLSLWRRKVTKYKSMSRKASLNEAPELERQANLKVKHYNQLLQQYDGKLFQRENAASDISSDDGTSSWSSLSSSDSDGETGGISPPIM